MNMATMTLQRRPFVTLSDAIFLMLKGEGNTGSIWRWWRQGHTITREIAMVGDQDMTRAGNRPWLRQWPSLKVGELTRH